MLFKKIYMLFLNGPMAPTKNRTLQAMNFTLHGRMAPTKD
jgi:hypothetical protein